MKIIIVLNHLVMINIQRIIFDLIESHLIIIEGWLIFENNLNFNFMILKITIVNLRFIDSMSLIYCHTLFNYFELKIFEFL